MKNKILFLFAMLFGLVMPSMAVKVVPDSIFVVKNGRITSSYEVGKDIDNFSFVKKQQVGLEGNCVLVGGEKVEMKSALIMAQGGLYYAVLSSAEGATTLADMMAADNVLQIAFSPELMGEDITLSKFGSEHEDAFFQVTYMDMKKYNEDDDYEPVSFSSDDWNDYFTEGEFCVTSDEDRNLIVKIDGQAAGIQAFAVQYKGSFSMAQQNDNSFTVNGDTKDLRAAFVEKVADGKAFYLTPGNIEKATDLDNCYYYLRLFVPDTNMDGEDIDINGNKEYELTFHDNFTDINHPYQKTLSNGMTGNAFGDLSVLDNGDGSYDIKINIQEIDSKYDLQVTYSGTPDAYDLSVPSLYTKPDGEEVALKSAVMTYDEQAETYTVYLSSKENVSTLEGMADADIVVTMPEDFVNDDMLHGFSGTEMNGKIAVSYDGDTFRQTNTGGDDADIALGGNAKLSFGSGKVNVDFSLFGIKKYSGNLKGHYEGNVTRL